MAKRDQLISRGARLLDIPTPEPSQPDEIAEVRKLVEGATAQAQAAENAAKAIDAINKQQADLMRELIAKMPVQKDIPKIIGFDIIRDSSDGPATGVMFIREGDKKGKRRLNS